MFLSGQNSRQLAGRLLIALFVFYFVGITFFPHKHIVNNQVIVHSHPFSGNEPHSHSTNVINLLFQLSNLNIKIFISGVFIIALSQLLRVIYRKSVSLLDIGCYIYSNFSRPPPSSL